jgi:hypothetical protein
MFENRVLRRIFGLKRDKVIGGWRKLHNVELRNFNCLPSIIKMMKSRRIEMGRSCSMHIEFWWESLKERDY